MLYIIGICILLFMIYRYKLQDADAGSSEYIMYILFSLIITCLVIACRVMN